MAEQMNAWQLDTPGNIQETLKLNQSAARPTAKDLKGQEILVQVSSASINPADYKGMQLGFIVRTVISFPKTLGMDLSGKVLAVGPAVTDILVGDHVLGRLNPLKASGALAEYAILERDGYAKINRDVDLDQAAGAGTAALTAYQCIKPFVKAGDKIFINGGSGGTGTFGIQIAKILGCHVTVTCSTAKAALCKELGADEIIDYKTTDILSALQKAGPIYSVFIDNVGAVSKLFPKSSSFLLPTAPFLSVSSGGSLGHVVEVFSAYLRPSFLGGGKNRFMRYWAQNSRNDFQQLAEWYNKKSLISVIDSTYELGDVLAAFEQLKRGSSIGKIIIHITPRL
ncbi:reticulon-4-interacting protein 1 [Cordyceps fumosorosea ARSEF 2679]|uniref:Reticulon-4-interacting protein 1 n=1 Tax=Cordyceps fumosorosea (strain ARSEF 2679) TaxID=1081104 RepID=A0A167ILT7_CORFA|nr:reticulon-4-interacting protein 1 [Cordyceps fumosorosea ARSEF 2679]OAA49211.1 reticulon-4-interacting protein 1 [Cordyceps fumosorosea ARSEF 2679]